VTPAAGFIDGSISDGSISWPHRWVHQLASKMAPLAGLIGNSISRLHIWLHYRALWEELTVNKSSAPLQWLAFMIYIREVLGSKLVLLFNNHYNT
jgi:hypothetical protein